MKIKITVLVLFGMITLGNAGSLSDIGGFGASAASADKFYTKPKPKPLTFDRWAKTLKLTEPQIAEVKKLQAQWQTNCIQIRLEKNLPAPEINSRIENATNDYRTSLDKVLTDAQKRTLKALEKRGNGR